MAEKTRTCPACGGMMTVRLGEFQCQQCGNTVPLVAPEESKQSGYSAPSYGSRGSGYSEIGSSLGSTKRPSRLPLAPPPAVPHEPGGQYRSAPPPPPERSAPPVAYAGAGSYGGSSGADGGYLETEKKVFVAVLGLYMLAQVGFGFMGSAAVGIGTLVVGAIVFGLYYWAMFGPELWTKWTCTGCLGLGLIATLVNMFSGATYLHLIPQLQGFSDHALQSFLLVSGILQLLWTGWIISILVRDALYKQQGI